jgi:hypothetical protein
MARQGFSQQAPKSKRQKTQQKHNSAMSGMLPKAARKQGVRATRRATVDPVTTHVVMEQLIALRTQGKLTKPKPDLAPRIFPGSRTVIGTPEKKLW